MALNKFVRTFTFLCEQMNKSFLQSLGHICGSILYDSIPLKMGLRVKICWGVLIYAKHCIYVTYSVCVLYYPPTHSQGGSNIKSLLQTFHLITSLICPTEITQLCRGFTWQSFKILAKPMSYGKIWARRNDRLWNVYAIKEGKTVYKQCFFFLTSVVLLSQVAQTYSQIYKASSLDFSPWL